MKHNIKTILYEVFSILLILLIVSCKDKLTYDENGILLYENLTPQTEEYWDAVHPSFWFPVKKAKGPFMFLGENKYSGKIVKYLQNGKLEFEGTYSDGVKTGEWKYYFENGKVKSIHSEGHNKIKKFYKNGDIKSHFIRNNSRDTTYFISYYKNRNIKYKHHFFTSNNRIESYEKRNLKGEVYEFFNEDSIYIKKDSIKLDIIEKGFYKNRRKTGTWIKYLQSGQPLWVKNYSKNELHGIFEEYHDSGSIQTKGQYSNGEKFGKWYEYYTNGKIRIIANFKKNKLEGVYKVFYKNGQIEELKEYYAGEPLGNWIYYDDDGEIWKKEKYK